jgi:hypothetical protein
MFCKYTFETYIVLIILKFSLIHNIVIKINIIIENKLTKYKQDEKFQFEI